MASLTSGEQDRLFAVAPKEVKQPCSKETPEHAHASAAHVLGLRFVSSGDL